MSHRPERIRILHELGKQQSLAAGTDQFDVLGNGETLLVLGMGPDPALAAQAVAERCGTRKAPRICYVECDDFARQMPPAWHAALPADWERLAAPECTPEFFRNATTLCYRPNLRLFPSFWGRLVAAAQWQHMQQGLPPKAPSQRTPSVILPGTDSGLLIRELYNAFSAEGYHVHRIEPEAMATELPRLLRTERPALFFSVNGQGLDMFGERQNLLEAAGVRVAVWCVDTPWHILSGFKTPAWKDALLLVTDHTFMPALQAAGARQVVHLPLATDPAIFTPQADGRHAALADRVVFVGRSEFPAHKKYFSGIIPDADRMQEAQALMVRGERADYHWWAEQLNAHSFWPDTPRAVGAAAQQLTRYWRTECLRHAVPYHLTVFGDAGWSGRIEGLDDLRPPVDYYAELPDIFHHASVSLNITGLLLPGGLTQRHFDVWAAGGILLTDATPGMHIFPRHLAEAVTFRRAGELPSRINHVLGNRHMANQLRTAWRTHILEHHTYRHRVRTVLEAAAL